MWHQIIPLGHANAPNDRNPYSLFTVLPERRIEIRFGKFSMAELLRFQLLRYRQQFSIHELDRG